MDDHYGADLNTHRSTVGNIDGSSQKTMAPMFSSTGYHAININQACTNGPGPFFQPYSTTAVLPHNGMAWGYQFSPYSGQYFGNGGGPLHNLHTPYAGFPVNNINQTWPYGPGVFLGESSQSAGSFSNLLMRASSGAMNFDISGRAGLDLRGNCHEPHVVVDKPEQHCDEDEETSVDTDTEGGFHSDNAYNDSTECDDEGYLGGQECEDENNDAGSTEIDDEPITNFEEKNMDVEMIYDTGSESESDGEQEGPKSVHLGDCGCITGDDVDCVAHGTEDLSSDSGDSDESEREEENNIDVDFSQEIYIDKAQEGVPYRKRKRIPKG